MKTKEVVLIMLIICWMATIFIFSGQVSDKSSNTSGKTIKLILDRLPKTKNMNNYEKQKLIEKLQTPVRKLAHFSIYAIGGILSNLLFCQYKITNKRKLIYSLLICALYAITDEFHQYFVPRKKLRSKGCVNRFIRSVTWNIDNVFCIW